MNTTLVTGLYDIGRGKWNNVFQRSHNEYLEYFKNILSLDSNLIVFIDEKDLNTVQVFRAKVDPFFEKTKIITKKFTELEAFQKFYEKCKVVMQSDNFLKNRHEAHTKIYREDNLGKEKYGVYKQKTWVPKKYE